MFYYCSDRKINNAFTNKIVLTTISNICHRNKANCLTIYVCVCVYTSVCLDARMYVCIHVYLPVSQSIYLNLSTVPMSICGELRSWAAKTAAHIQMHQSYHSFWKNFHPSLVAISKLVAYEVGLLTGTNGNRITC